MNPVDHPHGGVSAGSPGEYWDVAVYLTRLCRVTINTLVRRRQSRGTLPRVRRRVLLLRGERVCCGVPRRRRSKAFMCSSSGQGVHGIALVIYCFVVTGLLRRTENLFFLQAIMAVNELKDSQARGRDEACFHGNVLQIHPESQGNPKRRCSQRGPTENTGSSLPLPRGRKAT
jgi:hypothetical protein